MKVYFFKIPTFLRYSLIFIGVLSAWLLYWLIVNVSEHSLEELAQSGDIFGSLNRLFSGFAFAGLLVTLLAQRQELKLQREEITATREEFEIQRLENRYFATLNLLTNCIENMRHQYADEEIKGRQVLEVYAGRIKDESFYDNNPDGVIDTYVLYFENEFERNLGPNFRLMYNCIRQIEMADISEDEKLAYSKILRAQLSSAEVKLLHWNCLSYFGSDFLKWVRKHQLTKHLPETFKKENPESIKTVYGEA